jgi:glycosyltransferase involved in cell wall biosynthesis
MGSLRVCLLAPDFLPVWGGAGTYAVEIARELASRVDLTVLTLERANANGAFSQEKMEEVLDHRARVEVISEARDNFRYNAAFQMAVLRRLPTMARQERFDLVHSQHAHMPDIMYRRIDRSLPVLRTVHSTIAGQRAGIVLAQRFGGGLDPSENWQIALEPLLRFAEWMTLRDSDQIVAVSHFMENQLAQLGVPRAKVRVVYNGVRIDRFRPDAPGRHPLGGPANGPVVLYSGRPTLMKGIGVLIDAIPRVLQEVPNAHFAFAGGSEAEFLGLTQGRNLPMDHIHLLGRIRYEDLPDVYGSADVAVAPTFADNVPFWVMEAMASGVPVIASRVGGIPELIVDGKTGVLVPPGSPPELADALIALLKDDERRRSLGRAARTEIVDRFTWSRAATETIGLYRSTLDGGAEATSGVRSPAAAS